MNRIVIFFIIVLYIAGCSEKAKTNSQKDKNAAQKSSANDSGIVKINVINKQGNPIFKYNDDTYYGKALKRTLDKTIKDKENCKIVLLVEKGIEEKPIQRCIRNLKRVGFKNVEWKWQE